MPNFIQQLLQQAMKKKGGDLIAPVLNRSVGKLGPRDLVSPTFRTHPLRDFPGLPLKAPGLPTPPVKGASSRGLSPAAAGGITVGGLSAGVLAGASNLFGDPFGITQALAGTVGKPNQSRMSLLGGVNTDPFIPTTTPMQRAKVGQPMVLGGRLGYKAADGSWQPRGDMESENIPQYLPGSPQADKRGYVWDSSGQQFAAERAYQQEKSRVEQLTAQDPELKRYEDARKLAVAPGATEQQIQSAEDIGMQIWAQKNPGLAANVKSGQAGYDVIQGTLAGQAAAQGYGYQMPQQIMMTPPPGVNVPQGLPAVQSMTPTETYGAQGLEVDPEMRKKFQALLDKTAQAQ